MATHLSRTCDATSGGGYSNKWTWSGWVKRAKLGAEQGIIGNQRTDNNTNSRFKLYFRSTDRLGWECKDSGGSDDSSFETNALFRDTNAWYHICFIYDSDNSTATERIKCYVNGLDVRTAYGGFSSDNQGGSGFGTLWSSSVKNYLGTSGNNSGIAMQFEGCMSHCYLTYGHRYEASTFGETDSTTGEWKIKTSPSLTYGSQGYSLLKNNNSVTDLSGEGNNYTTTGTLTKTEDCPSNVFATWNRLALHPSNTPTLSNGNNTVVGVDTSSQTVSSTLAMPKKGKWYCEMKLTQEANATSSIPNFGIIDAASLYKFRNQEIVVYNGGVNSYGGRVNTTNLAVDGSDSGTISSAPDVGDIMGLAVDLDSSPNTLKYYLNGSLVGTQNINNDEYVFACSIKNDNNAGQVDVNFGNGYFGTTAVATNSGNGYAGAEGSSIFNYQPPTGYSALSTKGLNE